MKLFTLNIATKYCDGGLIPTKDLDFNLELDPFYPQFLSAIGRSDILPRMLGTELFSTKLKNLLEPSGQFHFQPTQIFLLGELISQDYYAFDVIQTIDLIDYENSQLSGNPFFDQIKIHQKNIPADSFVVMDSQDPLHYYFTPNFIRLIQQNGLDIDFSEVNFD